MAQYMLLIRGNSEMWNGLSPEQIQVEMQRYFDWAAKLRAEGRYVGGEELKDGGHTVRMHDGQMMVDGPYIETKDNVGGYYAITAADLAEATEVAKGCPSLTHGYFVEVREVVEYS